MTVTPPQDVGLDEPVIDIHIRAEDPLFGRGLELANEIVAALVYGIWEPSGDGTTSLPTLSAAVNEINNHPDPALLGMLVFTLARERRCCAPNVLQEFLLRPVQ